MLMNCRRITIDPAAAAMIEKRLETTPAIYPVTNSKIRKLLITSGTQSLNLSQIIRGPIPRSIMCCFVSAKALDNHITKNPFFFQHFKNNYFNPTLNGNPIVPKVFQPDCANGYVMREYKWFLNNIGCFGQESVDIGYHDFLNNSFIYAFDLSPDLCNAYYLHGNETGTFDLEIAFKEPLTENVNCIVYGSYNEYVTIDKDRNVTVVQA